MLLSKSPKDIAAPVVEKRETISENENSFATKKQALMDIKELLDAGILTQDEFDIQKKKILEN